MTFELLEKLESKINQAVETITLLQMEIEELKEDKANLAEKAQQLQEANQRLSEDHQRWQDRLSVLVGKMDQVEDAVE